MRFVMRTSLTVFSLLLMLLLVGCPFLSPNNPPVLSIPDQTVCESDNILKVDLHDFTEDPDNDPLTFKLLRGDIGEVIEHYYVYYPEYGDAGEYEIRIEVVDWREGRAKDSFVVTVERFAEKPSNPLPEDGSVDLAIDIELSWECPDPDNKLFYDIYLAQKNEDLKKIEANTKETHFLVQGLEHNSEYSWRVVVKDGKGGERKSPVWSFKTSPPPGLSAELGIIVARADKVDHDWGISKEVFPRKVVIDRDDEVLLSYVIDVRKDEGTTTDSTFTVNVDIVVSNEGPSVAQDVCIKLFISELGVQETVDCGLEILAGDKISYVREFVSKEYHESCIASILVTSYNSVSLSASKTAETPLEREIVLRIDDTATLCDEITVPEGFSVVCEDCPSFPHTILLVSQLQSSTAC